MSRDLEVEGGVAAATAMQSPKHQVSSGVEALVLTLVLGTDPIALLKSGLSTEQLHIALFIRELELEARVELMYLRKRALELDRQSSQHSPVSMRSPTTPKLFDVTHILH